MLMVVLGLCGAWLRWRHRLYTSKALARFALWMGPSGLVALLAGWYVTEIGRQPWVVYGLMRTKDAVSNHSAMTLSVGLVVLVVMYLGIFGTGIVYMLRLVGKGPQEHEHHELDAEVTANQRPARPLSAVDESLYSSTPKSH
ncbi:Cytochrome bd ubiquinol oxidase subunit 1 [compost metagenome]